MSVRTCTENVQGWKVHVRSERSAHITVGILVVLAHVSLRVT